KAGHFLGAFLFVTQQHEERSQLGVLGAPIQQHAHGLVSFGARQATRAALALAEDANELGKGMFNSSQIGHMQLVGFGRPASLAASLAGVPLKRRFRCRLLPFSGPSLRAAYLIKGRVAGESWNSA